MNSAQRKLNKITKYRKRRILRKKRLVENHAAGNLRISNRKSEFIKELKKSAKENISIRQRAFDKYRNILQLQDTEIVSFGELEKRINALNKKDAIKKLQSELLNVKRVRATHDMNK